MRLAILLFFLGPILAQEPKYEFKRLPPSAFRDLPPAVAQDLESRGCLIPQSELIPNPHNVVKGSFARPGQTDWAVLCSLHGISSILVFWNGSVKDPASLAAFDDSIYVQSMGPNGTQPTFSRILQIAGKEFIEGHYQAYGGLKPPPIDHQGIDDSFAEKGSVVWYFYEGKWMKLTGSD